MVNNSVKNILFVSASTQHAILDNKLCDELEKKGYSCYHVTVSKEAYDWLKSKNKKCVYLIKEREKHKLTKNLEHYLTQIENQYLISTNRILTGDIDHSRIKRTKAYEYMIKEFFFWEDFITKNKIDLMISGIERFYQMIPRAVLNSKNKQTFIFDVGADSNHYRITRDQIYGAIELKKALENTKFSPEEIKEAAKILEGLKKKKQMMYVSKVIDRGYGRPTLDLYNLNFFLKRLWNQFFVEKNKNVYGNIINIGKQKAIQSIRKHISKIFYEKFDNIKSEKYFFYAIPAYTDAQVTVRCPEFIDQLNMIKYIAKSLPAGYKLFVKEHPMYPGVVTIKQLIEIKKLPNLRILHPQINSHDIILNSRGVIVVNSTTGWEAIYHGKPTIILGKPPICKGTLEFTSTSNLLPSFFRPLNSYRSGTGSPFMRFSDSSAITALSSGATSL